MLFRPAHVLRLGIPAALIAATLITVTGSSGQAAQPQPRHLKFAAGSSKPVYEPTSVVVKFKHKATSSARKQALSKHASKAGASITSDIVTVTGSVPAPELLKKLKAEPSVELASLNYIRKATATPNDELYLSDQKYLPTVRMPQAWDLTKTAGSQTIAVLDTGVDAGHPELVGRTVPGYNVINPGAAPVDDNGHGTFVSGVIAANTSNTDGIAGVAWNAKVQPVKVLNSDGEGTDENFIAGINWAASHGARVINMSLGNRGDNPVLHDALTQAVAKGIVVVSAAGNTGDGDAQYPAAYPEVLAVGATDDSAVLTSFSTHGDWVDIAAPGFNLASTVPRALAPDYPYGIASGTSFSSAIVSGVAALVRNKYPTLTPAQVMARLKATARDAGPRGIDRYYGAGILDAYAALGGRWAADFTGPASDGNDLPAQAVPVTIDGNWISGAIDTEGDIDWYSLDSATARNVWFTVGGKEYNSETFAQNFGPVLTIYDKSLKPLGFEQTPLPPTNEDGSEHPQELSTGVSVSLPAGTSYVAVRSYNGSRTSRPYTLTIANWDEGHTSKVDSFWVRDAAPAHLASGVALNVAPSVTFARDMATATINTDTVRLLNGKTGASVPSTLVFDPATNKATVTPTAPLLDNTPYRISVGAVQDAQGELSNGFSSYFSTVDLTPPVLGSFDATGAYLAADLSWKIPAISDLDQVIVRRNVGSKAPTLTTGTLVYAGTASAVKATGLAQATTYTFAAWVKDRSGKVSPAAVTQLLGTKMSINTTSKLLTYGGAVTLKGSMLRIDNRPIPGSPIAVYWRPKNVASFKLLTTLKTSSTGSVSLAYKPTVSSVFAMAYLGSGELMGSRTVNVLVEVKPAISAAISPTAITLGATTKFYGSVRPAHAGRPVYLQQYVSGTWRTLSSVKLSSNGSYAFGIRPKTRGTFAYRAVFTADADHAQAISANKTVTVR
jgi:serine protease